MTEQNPSFFIGADGGGTGCRVAIADAEGRVRAIARGGPTNVTTAPDQAISNLLDTVRRSAQEAGLNAADIRAAPAHIGLAGVMTDGDAATVQKALPMARCTVTDDRPTTVTGALGSRDGAVAAIGTGSFVAFRRDARVWALGGWGLTLGDQASGAWLGRAALERTLLATDGLSAPSALTDRIHTHFGQEPNALVAFARDAAPSDFATFAPWVIEAAEARDANAQALMVRGAAYIDTCLQNTGLRPEDPLCLTGGLGPHYEPYLAPVNQARLHAPEGTALEGAVLLARQIKGSGP